MTNEAEDKVRLMRQPAKFAACFPHATFVCLDGGLLCAACVAENAALIAKADPCSPQWNPQWAVHACRKHPYQHPQLPDPDDICDHCYKSIK